MYRILVADDEPIERKVVEKIINENFAGQLEVIMAVNGREAVELFEIKQCHIVLLDIEMPGINGLKAAEMIRERNKDCNIFFLTAFDEFSYAKRAIGVRALDYLLKPVAVEELVNVLEEAIRLTQEQEARKELLLSVIKSEGETTDIKEENRSRIVMSEEAQSEKPMENLRMNAVSEAIRSYIAAHYMEKITLQDVAAAMNYSDVYFCKLFKQCFDKSFVSYLTIYRIEKTKEILADVRYNVKDVGEKVGYKDSNYFTKVFKRIVGMTPTEYREQVLQNGEDR